VRYSEKLLVWWWLYLGVSLGYVCTLGYRHYSFWSKNIFFSTKHNVTGTLHFVFGAWSWIVGTFLGVLIWTELQRPGSSIGEDQIYSVIVTVQASVIIFFIVVPIIFGGFGNWLVSLILRAPDMALPRINNIKILVNATSR